MALDSSQEHVAERLAKLDELRRRGVDPYPYRFDATHSVSDIRARFEEAPADRLEADPPHVRVGGRVMSQRSHGKAAFLDLSDGIQRVQVYLRTADIDD